MISGVYLTRKPLKEKTRLLVFFSQVEDSHLALIEQTSHSK
jgi:hypothetical protein